MQIRVRKIDGSRIEIRTIHEIAPHSSTGRKKNKRRGFELNAYFFVPNKLTCGGGDELDGAQTLAQTIVYPKIHRKNYYAIFAMNLAAILDSDNELSPLTRLQKMAKEVSLPAEQVLYEFQMLACVTKNASMNARHSLTQQLRTRNDFTDIGTQQNQALSREAETEFKNISQAYLQVQRRLDLLGERYLQEVLQNIDEAYRWTLEDLNHQILDCMLSTLRLSEHYQFSPEFRKFLQTELGLQWRYQKQHGFATLSDDEYNNESYLFHQRELKAWRYSGLSMTSTEARSLNVINHLWLSVASAVAMSVAFSVTLLTIYYYGQWSIPFLIFGVLGYMFKDRIKEILRNLFSDKFCNYNLLHLYDPRSKEQCGSIRESLGFCEKVPVEILTLRHLRKNPLSSQLNREVAIVYRERLSLNSQKLFETHKRLQRGCQVLEFNLLPYLQNIRDSEAKQLWKPADSFDFAEATASNQQAFAQTYQKLKIKRSYHLTLVIKSSSFNGQKVHERYRIVLRNSKIFRIKKII